MNQLIKCMWGDSIFREGISGPISKDFLRINTGNNTVELPLFIYRYLIAKGNYKVDDELVFFLRTIGEYEYKTALSTIKNLLNYEYRFKIEGAVKTIKTPWGKFRSSRGAIFDENFSPLFLITVIVEKEDNTLDITKIKGVNIYLGTKLFNQEKSPIHNYIVKHFIPIFIEGDIAIRLKDGFSEKITPNLIIKDNILNECPIINFNIENFNKDLHQSIIDNLDDIIDDTGLLRKLG